MTCCNQKKIPVRLNAHEFRVAADMLLHEMIQPERGQKAHADDSIQLNGD